MHPILEKTLAKGFVQLSCIDVDTLAFAKSLGEVFQPLRDENPIVTMRIEGNDPDKTPYASCRTPALSLHTDYATIAVPPRFTITHCIEPDPDFPRKGVSIVLLLAPVIEYLRIKDPSLLELLRKDVFPFRRNAEHDLYHAEVSTYPILEGDDRIRFDRTLIIPYLERSSRPDRMSLINSVMQFEQICYERAEWIEVALDRREVLIIDNCRVLHSRSQCTVRHDGERLLAREVNLAFLV